MTGRDEERRRVALRLWGRLWAEGGLREGDTARQ